MCLWIREKPLLVEALIASKDITVYKIGELTKARFRTPFFDYEYVQEVQQPLVSIGPVERRTLREDDFQTRIDEGYHSAPTIEDCKLMMDGGGYADLIGVFIIPKGTKYYEGVWGDDTDVSGYVSETIIYQGPYAQEL